MKKIIHFIKQTYTQGVIVDACACFGCNGYILYGWEGSGV